MGQLQHVAESTILRYQTVDQIKENALVSAEHSRGRMHCPSSKSSAQFSKIPLFSSHCQWRCNHIVRYKLLSTNHGPDQLSAQACPNSECSKLCALGLLLRADRRARRELQTVLIGSAGSICRLLVDPANRRSL
jgi:hypothetical protein